ncbi:MAG: hypothetical protein PW843_09190 [Azospirillaceae bacterium]|nr:hypothetical protein [Azospirillaceae bacterium]
MSDLYWALPFGACGFSGWRLWQAKRYGRVPDRGGRFHDRVATPIRFWRAVALDILIFVIAGYFSLALLAQASGRVLWGMEDVAALGKAVAAAARIAIASHRWDWAFSLVFVVGSGWNLWRAWRRNVIMDIRGNEYRRDKVAFDFWVWVGLNLFTLCAAAFQPLSHLFPD